MPLYLVRHGEAFSENVDPDRPLTEAGTAAVTCMAQQAAALRIPVSRIFHSGKTRARQTADIFSAHLKPSAGVSEIGAMKPYDEVTVIVPGLDPALNTMYVGHLPFLERLVSYLITGSQDKTVIRFQTGGMVCLDRVERHHPWHIKWALMPKMV